jgi:hemerythrin-like domain-containing protein
MGTDARELLNDLRDDHRNMGMVLNVLETAISATNPDFELVGEIIHYLTIYPDAVHHPKEDIIYAELRFRRPDLANGLDDVVEDHRRIAAQGSILRDVIEAMTAGAAVRREQFIGDLNRYVGRLRRHMQWEEEDLFQRIETMIDGESTEVDVDELCRLDDPVFGHEIDAAFRRLVVSLS